MFVGNETIAEFDAELAEVIKAETRRQEEHIELIASENYASPRSMEAQGSVLTNKYAEGYPGKRYYGGCEHVDKAEVLAIERAKNSSALTMPTCSRTRGHRQTQPFFWHCYRAVTPCWV